MKLPLPHPFSIHWAMSRLRTSSYGVPYVIAGADRSRRVLGLDGHHGVVEFHFVEGDGGRAYLNARALGGFQGRVSSWLDAPSRLVFGIDDDLAECYTVLTREARFRPTIERYQGLRLIKAHTVYESLLITMLGQQLSVHAAQAQRRRLISHFGETVKVRSEAYRGFPRPERLAETRQQDLREIGISRQKARYLVEIARRAADGRLERPVFDGLSNAGALDLLQEIPGVGPWTAEIVLMRALGHLDVFPAGDLGLQAAARDLFDLDHRPSEPELRDMSNVWSGWRSYAAFYLWMTLMEGGYA